MLDADWKGKWNKYYKVTNIMKYELEFNIHFAHKITSDLI